MIAMIADPAPIDWREVCQWVMITAVWVWCFYLDVVKQDRGLNG